MKKSAVRSGNVGGCCFLKNPTFMSGLKIFREELGHSHVRNIIYLYWFVLLNMVLFMPLLKTENDLIIPVILNVLSVLFSIDFPSYATFL